MDLSLRHHVEGVRRYFETAGAGLATQGSFNIGVGFADLSGYTAASLVLDLREIAGIVTEFEDRATEAITAGGGRVVKFVGDAVLYVCPDPDALLEISTAIVAEGEGLQARADEGRLIGAELREIRARGQRFVGFYRPFGAAELVLRLRNPEHGLDARNERVGLHEAVEGAEVVPLLERLGAAVVRVTRGDPLGLRGPVVGVLGVGDARGGDEQEQVSRVASDGSDVTTD
jgi:hypothetical protein